MKTKFIAFLAIVLMMACADNQTEMVNKPRYQIVKASESEINSARTFIQKGVSNEMISQEYNIAGMYRLVDTKSNLSILSALSKNDPQLAISFASDASGAVVFAFKSKTTKDINGNFVNEVYSLDGDLQIAYVDYTDGRRVTTFTNKKASGSKSAGWFSNWDNCVGSFHNLTGSNIGNIAVVAVFDAATLGLYTGVSLVFCAAVAALQ